MEFQEKAFGKKDENMASQKNKQLFVDRETILTLSLIKAKIFGEVNWLMDDKESESVRQNRHYNNNPLPLPFIFSPGGKRNQAVLQKAKKDDLLEIISDGKICGNIKVDKIFANDPKQRVVDIFGSYDSQNIKMLNLAKRFGELALNGELKLEIDEINDIKEKINNAKKSISAKKVTALMMRADPFHRAHERLMRISIDEADLLVIFLLSTPNKDSFSYKLREECLKYFINNYLPRQRVLIVPFENTYIFSDHNNPILECIAAYNFGCNKLVMGQNHLGIEIFFNQNQTHTVFDNYKKDLPLEIVILPEFVYCNACRTLVSTKTCPHGPHHHIKYQESSLKTLLSEGILPPAVLMRRDISSILLSSIFPNRFKNLQNLFQDMFPNAGLLEKHSEKDFYEELMKLYQTSSLT